MTTVNISLSSIFDVKAFVNVVSKYDFEIDLISGRYVVDAKSIMGIFSLDLTKPIRLEAHCEGACEEFLNDLKPFIVQ